MVLALFALPLVVPTSCSLIVGALELVLIS